MKIDGKNIKIYIGEVSEKDDNENNEEPYLPMPSLDKLREWDRKLLSRYKPKYHYSPSKSCAFCAFGPCDLDKNRKGACGMTLDVQTAREFLNMALMGASAHTAHARHALHLLIEKFGYLKEINVAENTEVMAPNTQLVSGIKPKYLKDLEKPLSYAEEQITHMVSSLHMGQEGSAFDYFSKAFHAGMIDHLGMEIADISQITALGFPKGDPEPKLVEAGFSSVDASKPVVLCVGHNVSTGSEIVNYVSEKNLDVEICGICCTALDIARYSVNKKQTKIVGPLSYQLIYLRRGIADVVVTDEQCVRVDTVEIAAKQNTPVIATSDKACYGFVDSSHEDADVLAGKLAFGEIKGCYISDMEKAGEVAVKTAILVHNRKIKDKKEHREHGIKGDEDSLGVFCEAENCIECGLCNLACPIGNHPKDAIVKIKFDIKRQKESEKNKIDKEIGEAYKETPANDNEKNKKEKSTIERVKELLMESSYTEVELSNILGCSRQNISRMIKKIKEDKKLKKENFYEYQDGNKIYVSFKPILKAQILSCVGCGLCMKKCPNGVDIKEIMRLLKDGSDLSEDLKVFSSMKKCVSCGLCVEVCPKKIDIPAVIDEQRKKYSIEVEHKIISDKELLEIGDNCLYCGRCESWCPKNIPVASIMAKIVSKRFDNEKSKLSPGRGPVQDVEIRKVGAPIVLGEIPGVIAIVGCSLYPKGGKELVEIAEEFLKRGYIVVTSGCSAMTLGIESVDAEGKSLYERYSGEFDGGCLVNVGSCVSNAHITGAAIKIAGIFAKRKISGNYEEIADYVYNRVGAVGLVWGTMSAKALSISLGVMRLGIPVVWGPSGIKYKAEFLSDASTNWTTYEAFNKGDNGKINVGPVPEHLAIAVKDKKEVMPLLAKLCIRPNDTTKGRQKKITHYIDLYKKFYNKMPEDLHKFIRTEADIPMMLKDEILSILKEKKWVERKTGDPTLLERLVKK